MEDKLRAYRREQQRQQFFENIRIRLRNMINPPRKEQEDVKVDVDLGEAEKTSELGPLGEEETLSSSEDELITEEKQKESPSIDSSWKYCLYALYFIFWATCFAIAVELQFGAVFLAISALLGIYFNTRTGPKKKNEISAYSVFNKNVESIDGTLKAEQFEREIRYGSMSVR